MEEITLAANQQLVLPLIWFGDKKNISYNIHLDGEGAGILLPAILLGKNNDTLDLQLNIYHNAPNTTSKIIVKGALTDRSFVNFDGLVKIKKGAKTTNAWLGANLLLLSNQAKGRAVPGLEIMENDIKAGHAATVGRVNEIEIFYLMSRGLSENDAKSLIIRGFLESLIRQFPKGDGEKAHHEISQFLNNKNN